MKSTSTINYRPDIDGMRALAVTLVVLFHADLAFPGGYVGVDVFFVISGFLITRLILADLEQDRFTFTGFWIRRVRRILPILFVVVLVTLALGLVHLWPDDLTLLARSALSVVMLVSNVFFWSDTGYFDAAVEAQPLLHTWSLAVEEQFYLLYPLLLVLLAKRFFSRHSFMLLLALSFSALVFSVLVWHRYPSAAFYLLPPRGWELLVGAVLASNRHLPQMNPTLNNALTVTGLLLVVGSAVLYDRMTPFPGYSAVVPVAGAAALIYAGSSGSSWIASVLSLKPLVYLGLISYSLYLWHWPLLVFARIRFPDVAHLEWWVIAISVVLSAVSWKLIEQPFRRNGASTKPLFVFVGVLFLAVLALCLAILASSGLPMRHAAFASLNRNAEFEVSDTALRSLSGVPLGTSQSVSHQDRVDFFVVGDSHAAFMLPMFDLMARETGVSGLSLARAGRKPFGDNRKHKPIHDAILQMIERHKPSVVFLVARWATLFGADTPTASYEENIALVQNIIQTGQRSNTQIWIVSQVPAFPLSRATLRYQITSSGKNTQQLTYPRIKPADLNHAASNASAAFATLVFDGASVLDLQAQLTDQNGEFTVGPSENIMYWDNNHLTQAGAIELLSPVFRPVLQRISNDSQRQRQ